MGLRVLASLPGCGGYFHFEPVVSLRSTTGYALGCLRHPDALHRAACDGERRA